LKKYLTNNLEAAITKKRIKGCIIPIDLGTSVIPYIAIIEKNINPYVPIAKVIEVNAYFPEYLNTVRYNPKSQKTVNKIKIDISAANKIFPLIERNSSNLK